MKQSDIDALAHQYMIQTHNVQPGENVWVEYAGEGARALADACLAACIKAGANVYLTNSSNAEKHKIYDPKTPDEIMAYGRMQLDLMKTMQAYIRIKDDADNLTEPLAPPVMDVYKKSVREMLDYRVNHTRWLVVAAPTKHMAAMCKMPVADFEKYYLDVCLFDYRKMAAAAQPLADLMTNGKSVRIVAPAQNTDLSFSIEGIPAKPCCGDLNIPDGECYTAPVKTSINGTISYGPSVYDGKSFTSIHLTFKDGKIVEAKGGDEEQTKNLNVILDRDEGARYIGEFAIGFNPYVLHPIGNILFDEKIAGSLHMAAGNCYDDAPNGNKSVNHWDMVHIQRPEYGGGEIWIDGRLIRKDGLFVVPELEALNPKNLIKA